MATIVRLAVLFILFALAASQSYVSKQSALDEISNREQFFQPVSQDQQPDDESAERFIQARSARVPILFDPGTRRLLAYLVFTPRQSKRAIIDPLGGDYLIRKRRHAFSEKKEEVQMN